MLIMEPPPFSNIIGKTFVIVLYIERTFRLNAKSHSSSVASKIVPLWTKPAQLNKISGRALLIQFLMDLSSRTSSSKVDILEFLISSSSFKAILFISVAKTSAPSFANAIADALPIP